MAALVAALLSAGLVDAAVATAESACTDLKGDLQSGTVCHVLTTTPTYTLDMRFGTEYPDGAAVAAYLSGVRDDLVSRASAPNAPFLPYEVYVSSQSFSSGQPQRIVSEYGRPRHGTESLVLQVFRDIEGLPVRVKVKSFTYDHDQSRSVTFDNLFAPGGNPIDSIYPMVKADLEKQLLAWHFTLKPEVGKDPNLYQNFAVTDDNVTFFFDQGQLASDKVGVLQVAVPRGVLPPLQI
ncbi:esterase [Mycobacterium sp. E1747]|uniref:esterase n=1 Tax=Mycobacterium sp. E1747 TaxID=1834128 RepID=UPI0007FBA353|nr:esterase [Mycobacterium sp. E1747]OBH05887.1 hypothetical protein A5695_06515 [Mycobacterium sp. E1747]